MKLAGAATAWLLAYAAGFRDGALVVVGFLAVIPAQLLVLFVSLRLFSVELEASGDARDVLYPVPVDTVPVRLPDVATSPTRVRGSGLWQLFKSVNEPRSMEGYALQAGFVTLAAFFAWAALLPVARAVFPGFDADRSGPNGFPVTVHIGQTTLDVTNGSNAPWKCQVDLGSEHLAASFDVAAWGTRPVPFSSFDKTGALEGSHIRAAAQDNINMTCEEASGITHSATLR